VLDIQLSSRHQFAGGGASIASFEAILHALDLLALGRTFPADTGALTACSLVMLSADHHEIGSSPAHFCASHQNLEVGRRNMHMCHVAAHHCMTEACLVAMKAGLDALFHLWGHFSHGILKRLGLVER
jgi:hypothetical protein